MGHLTLILGHLTVLALLVPLKCSNLTQRKEPEVLPHIHSADAQLKTHTHTVPPTPPFTQPYKHNLVNQCFFILPIQENQRPVELAGVKKSRESFSRDYSHGKKITSCSWRTLFYLSRGKGTRRRTQSLHRHCWVEFSPFPSMPIPPKKPALSVQNWIARKEIKHQEERNRPAGAGKEE